MKKIGVVIKSSKYVFGQPEVKFLGYLVIGVVTSPLPEKVEAIVPYLQ